MNKYVYLKKYCYLVAGENGIIIYNFKDNIVTEFSKEESLIVKELLFNKCNIYTRNNDYNIAFILKKLKDANLIEISENYYFNEGYRIGLFDDNIKNNDYIFNKCYIQLPSECEKNCKYCMLPKTNICLSCFCENKITNVNYDDLFMFYLKVLRFFSNYNFESYIFYGGNILKNKELLFELIEFLKSIIYDTSTIYIIIDIDNFEEYAELDFLNKHNINPIFVINNDYNDNIRIQYIKNKTSKIVYFRNKLNCNNDYIIATINLYLHELDMFNYIKKSLINIEPNILLNNSIIINKVNIKYEHEKIQCNPEIITFSKKHHPCLYGTINIKYDKTISPCPGFKNNLVVTDIKNLFSTDSKIYDYWNISIDKINNCKVCKYRYTCLDCRYIEFLLSNDLYDKRTCLEVEKLY